MHEDASEVWARWGGAYLWPLKLMRYLYRAWLDMGCLPENRTSSRRERSCVCQRAHVRYSCTVCVCVCVSRK